MNHPALAAIKWLFSVIGLACLFAGFFSFDQPSVPLVILGTVFAAIGLTLVAIGIQQGKREAFLLAHGRPVSARVAAVTLNQALEVNGRSPWVIVAQWLDPATRTLHEFRSKSLWFDPSDFITDENVVVRIDPANPRRYLMDTSVPPAAPASIDGLSAIQPIPLAAGPHAGIGVESRVWCGEYPTPPADWRLFPETRLRRRVLATAGGPALSREAVARLAAVSVA